MKERFDILGNILVCFLAETWTIRQQHDISHAGTVIGILSQLLVSLA